MLHYHIGIFLTITAFATKDIMTTMSHQIANHVIFHVNLVPQRVHPLARHVRYLTSEHFRINNASVFLNILIPVLKYVIVVIDLVELV